MVRLKEPPMSMRRSDPALAGIHRVVWGMLGRLIQAVRKVIPAPACFLDRGALWFVVRLYMLEQAGDELQRFSE